MTESNATPLASAPAGRGVTVMAAARRTDVWLARRLVAAAPLPIVLKLWDDTRIGGGGSAQITISVASRRLLWRLAMNPMLAFGDGYTSGNLSVTGDLAVLLEAFHRSSGPQRPDRSATAMAAAAADWLRRTLARPNALGRARESVEAHYNVGNDFFQKWLDPTMTYTCAYFSRPDASLDEAQLAKLSHVCRKLRLRKGQRVVDAGSGWGSLAIFMAQEFGVTVDGYCLASEQVEYAKARAQALGLSDRVRFVLDDYRNIRGTYDAVVSLGMLEHVGKRHHEDFAAVLDRCLKPDGIGLLHTEGRMHPEQTNAWFERRVFPGAYIASISEMVGIIDAAGCTIWDVENLGPHYALTLRHWLDRFERVSAQVESQYGLEFVRLWRLYLTSGMAAFRAGTLHLFQLLFTRRGGRVPPLTREDIYATTRGAT